MLLLWQSDGCCWCCCGSLTDVAAAVAVWLMLLLLWQSDWCCGCSSLIDFVAAVVAAWLILSLLWQPWLMLLLLCGSLTDVVAASMAIWLHNVVVVWQPDWCCCFGSLTTVIVVNAGLVVQSIMSATDTLGHRDFRPHYAQGCWHVIITGVGTAPHMSVRGDNTTPISNDGVAQLGPMVWSWVWIPAGADLRRPDHVQLGRPSSKEVIKQVKPTTLGPCNPELGLA